MEKNYTQLVRHTILNPEVFVRAVFSGRRRGHALPWTKVVLRPVLVNDTRRIQFSFFDETKDISKNYHGEVAEEQLDRLLELPFKNISVQTSDQDIQIRISNKGEPAIFTSKRAPVAIDLEHNRQKERILSLDNSRGFLEATGIAAKDGGIKADMQRKFLQINEFLKIIQETGFAEKLDRSVPLPMADLGCGNAYLTFAMYHYITNILGLQGQLTGVDVKADLIVRNAQRAHELGWQQLSFQAATIMDFEPAQNPAIVLALHACDTATDEALARGIAWGSGLIVSAPCCQHHLQEQLSRQPTPPPLQAITRHAILKERLGDMLTDTFRALILRIMGYSTDIIQFIATEHTPKNLMIRAVRSAHVGDARFIQEYKDLKAFWNVTPYLETLLGAEFALVVG